VLRKGTQALTHTPASAALSRLSARGLVSLVAVDEAHCVVDWGSSFRAAYRALASLRPLLGAAVPFVALTASATAAVLAGIAASLALREPLRVSASFDRPNVALEVRYPDAFADGFSVESDLRALIARELAGGGAAIVYCRKREECERLAKALHCAALPAAAYHGKLCEAQRADVSAAFARRSLRLVVATVAFGMGVDVADVRLVAHYNIPFSFTYWYQASGCLGFGRV